MNQHSPLAGPGGTEPYNVWLPDRLGGDYRQRFLDVGPDPLGEGELRAALIHYAPASEPEARSPQDRVAILHIHGVTDYFFQTHVAEHFHNTGLDFYALDLHKCGRAHLPGQTWHFDTDLRHYFPELVDATRLILESNAAIVLLAHSTGGLIVASWLDHLRRAEDPLLGRIRGAIFNSPWLDMIVPAPVARAAAPALKVIGRRWPMLALPRKEMTAYGEALHVSRHGVWDYDLGFKPLGGHAKYVGWLRTVIKTQEPLHAGHFNCGVPVLTLCSDRSTAGKPYSEASHVSDSVLNVHQIRRWAPYLSDSSALEVLHGAVHDVFLSSTEVTDRAFKACDGWLAQHALAE